MVYYSTLDIFTTVVSIADILAAAVTPSPSQWNNSLKYHELFQVPKNIIVKVSRVEKYNIYIYSFIKVSCYKYNTCIRHSNFNWRVSEASETLSGITQLKILKIGDICLYICLNIRKAFLYFDPCIFVLVLWSNPSQTSLNRILRFIDQYPYHPRNWIVYRFVRCS